MGSDTPETAPWLTVLDFWFRELTPDDWFSGSDAVDREICERFSGLVHDTHAGKLDHWADAPRGRLSLIIVIDQFSRNIFRDQAQAFAADEKARGLVRQGLAANVDKAFTLSERQFFYMPLMHAEDAETQAESVALFENLAADVQQIVAFAKGHAQVVEKFGRFPMRNAALDRASSEAEQAYIDAGGGFFLDGM